MPEEEAHWSKERVLCVRRTHLWEEEEPTGFLPGSVYQIAAIRTHPEMVERGRAETDESFQQIIPFTTAFRNNRTEVFAMIRRNQSTETRLHGQCTVSIGGHVSDTAEVVDEMILSGLMREWEEEVYAGSSCIARFAGIVNDTAPGVSRVHVGLAFVVDLPEEATLSIREEEKLEGSFLPVADVLALPHLESWSRFTLEWAQGHTAMPCLLPDAVLPVSVPTQS